MYSHFYWLYNPETMRNFTVHQLNGVFSRVCLSVHGVPCAHYPLDLTMEPIQNIFTFSNLFNMDPTVHLEPHFTGKLTPNHPPPHTHTHTPAPCQVGKRTVRILLECFPLTFVLPILTIENFLVRIPSTKEK